MILSEFKAWFEGYTEGLEGAPTKAQFERIKEKVKEINGEPITERIFIDRYWPTVVRPWSPPYYHWINASGGYATTSGGYATTSGGYATTSGGYATGSVATTNTTEFNSTAAMYAIGKADAVVN